MVTEKQTVGFVFVFSSTRSIVLYSPTSLSHFHKLQSVSFHMVPSMCISLLQGLSYRKLDLVMSHFRWNLNKRGRILKRMYPVVSSTASEFYSTRTLRQWNWPQYKYRIYYTPNDRVKSGYVLGSLIWCPIGYTTPLDWSLVTMSERCLFHLIHGCVSG